MHCGLCSRISLCMAFAGAVRCMCCAIFTAFSSAFSRLSRPESIRIPSRPSRLAISTVTVSPRMTQGFSAEARAEMAASAESLESISCIARLLPRMSDRIFTAEVMLEKPTVTKGRPVCSASLMLYRASRMETSISTTGMVVCSRISFAVPPREIMTS